MPYLPPQQPSSETGDAPEETSPVIVANVDVAHVNSVEVVQIVTTQERHTATILSLYLCTAT